MNVASLPLLIALSSLAPTAVPPRLVYEAPSDCPSRPDFVAAVSARDADVAVDAGVGAVTGRQMVVAIHRSARGFEGAFQVRDAEGVATRKREVHGLTCAVVVDALAVVTAIELRPTETDAARAPAAPPATPASAAASAPPEALPQEPAAAPRDDGRLVGSTRFFPPRTETVQVQAGELRFDLSRSATLSAGAMWGLIPSVALPHYELSFSLANFITAPGKIRRISGPLLELHVGFLGPATKQASDTKTDVYGLSFGIGICQSPYYDSKGFVLAICGEYGGGYLNLMTKNLDGTGAHSKAAGFGEIDAVVDAQYHLTSRIYVGVRISGGLTIGDITAERIDGSRIFRSSGWLGTVTGGLGVRF